MYLELALPKAGGFANRAAATSRQHISTSAVEVDLRGRKTAIRGLRHQAGRQKTKTNVS